MEEVIERRQHRSTVSLSRSVEAVRPVYPRVVSHAFPALSEQSPVGESDLFNEGHEEFDDALQRVFFKWILVRRQETENIRETIVYRIILGGQLCEEHFSQIRDTTIFILQTLGHLSKLSLDFDLAC